MNKKCVQDMECGTVFRGLLKPDRWYIKVDSDIKVFNLATKRTATFPNKELRYDILDVSISNALNMAFPVK